MLLPTLWLAALAIGGCRRPASPWAGACVTHSGEGLAWGESGAVRGSGSWAPSSESPPASPAAPSARHCGYMYGSTPTIVVTPSCNAPLVGWSTDGSPVAQQLPAAVRSATFKHSPSAESVNIEVCSTGDEQQDERDGPTDGGWGWVVVVCSLALSLILDGISYSFGLIYKELLKEFHESKSKTSWVNALFLAVPLLSGPLASNLVERFGCRSMTILGGVLGAAGFVLSAVVGSSIEVLLLTYGVITGLGMALCYVTAVVGVAYWFDKKLSMANGLGVCGTGIGTFIMAPVTQLLIETYSWRGATVLLGRKSLRTKFTLVTSTANCIPGGVFLQMCVCGALMREPQYILKQRKNQRNNDNNNSGETLRVQEPEKVRRSLTPAPLEGQLAQHRHSLTYRGAMVCLQPRREFSEDNRATSCPDLLLQVKLPSRAPVQRPHYWLDAGLFLEPAFLLLSVSTLLLFMSFIVPYLYLAEHLLRKGYTDNEAAFLISVIGVPNTLAMVFLGWAGDKPWLPVSKTYAVCLIVCVIFFGLSFAANYSFTPVLLVQLVAMERFSAAYGLMLLVQGAGNLIGPPLAGMISDLTGNWDLAFYLAGVLTVIAGFLTFLIPLYSKPLPSRKKSSGVTQV
ncbi:Hypothetical predicted protein [Cloeon dipterum]|uniref:Major facilitator superfamily (MFS) profile domain-containing protein n=1 Tax=Cloeon dipterum TaxID=197152 RepID=A0A8S1CEL3_9INSE|nr:Hypothetical predicted protein [Cloeon dipterum]